MMRAGWTSLGKWFGRWSFKTQMLALVTGFATLCVVVLGWASYERQIEQSTHRAVQWSQALATLAANAVATPMIERDLGSLDVTLQRIIAMPGLRSVQVARSGGAVVMRIRHSGNGEPVTEFLSGVLEAPPPQAFDLQGDHVHAHASLLIDPSRTTPETAAEFERYGWVSVEFGFEQDLQQAHRTWLQGSTIALALVGGALWLFSLFLNRAVGPIAALGAFAARIVQEPGSQLRIRWGSHEVRELGRAINWASRELADQIDTTQQRLQRQRAILDTAADAIIGVSAEGRVSSANPAAERIFGRSYLELRGQPMEQLLADMDAGGLATAVENGLLIHSTQSRIGKLELDAMRQDGTRFPAEALIGEVPDDEDVRFVCIVRDLSDTKLAEEYLTLYSRAVDCAINGIAISDARRHPQPFVYVNPSFTRITGYAPHEILGRDGSILEGPDTNPSDIEVLYKTQQAGGELTIVLRNYRKGGALFHNKLSISPVRNDEGQITHYINIIEDVSGQIEVKQRLIERTARLNATFDLSPDGFAVFDKSGELIASNPAFRAMVGDIPGWCSLSRFDNWFRNLCDNGEDYRTIDQALQDRRKDVISIVRPSPKVLEREIRRNLGGSGETILYFRDVTHQVEVDRIKSEFLATAAHELRTPLASILGFTELLLHRKYNEERQKDMLGTVHRQGTLLQNLIQELLDLSRIEARQGKDFHIVPHSLLEIVRNAIGGITNADAGRIVHTEEPMAELQVMADATKIEQALTNLLSNAFKYSPHGGRVSLRVESAEHDGEPVALIHVSDQGLGMTPEQLARAFERFYRADTSGNIPGTGLGLNLVKEIAEIHGGGVSLSSQIGVGTVATLRLRLAQVTQEQSMAEQST